jgi:uncharacterized surface protein with fasciclin (FAS1) repeats
MKKQVINSFRNGIRLSLILVAAMAIFAVSCEKEKMLPLPDLDEFELPGQIPVPPVGPPEIVVPDNPPAANRAPAPGANSIAQIAIDAGFSELVNALLYVDEELDAGLVELFLNGIDQFTVFAPTNEAFENLFEFLEIDEISDLPAELVLDVLLYHVAEGRRAANSVVPRVGIRAIKTLLGASFTVNPNAVITDIFGQEAQILTPNISASNGIIHVIDTVILPIESE